VTLTSAGILNQSGSGTANQVSIIIREPFYPARALGDAMSALATVMCGVWKIQSFRKTVKHAQTRRPSDEGEDDRVTTQNPSRRRGAPHWFPLRPIASLEAKHLGVARQVAGRTGHAPLLIVFTIQLTRAYHNSWMTVRLAVHLNTT
jgi:hypothetical protein